MKNVTSPAPPNSKRLFGFVFGNNRSCGDKRRWSKAEGSHQRRSTRIRPRSWCWQSSEWAMRLFVYGTLTPQWTRTSPLPRRARKQLMDVMWVGEAEAAELSHLAAAGPRASPRLMFQLCSSRSHCRATVPPIGNITATPHALVFVALLRTSAHRNKQKQTFYCLLCVINALFFRIISG